MTITELQETTLIGIALPDKTTNENGQSRIDCGKLWQEFESGKYVEKIPNKTSNEVLAVYHDYDGDYTQPYSYFIGCKVAPDTEVPEGLTSITIPAGNFRKITTRGKMPDCVANAWKEIWDQDGELNRKYTADFEVYGAKSQNRDDDEVDIYLSVE